ncbi:MAG: VWA domain-containing protein [Acidobacteriota bacterium]
MRFRSKVAAVLGGAILIGGGVVRGAAAKPKPEERIREEARVTVVEVPVNVVDKDGKPVEGLTADDFEIFDDGKKETITGLDVLDQRANVRAPKPGDPPINPAARRHFLLLFDMTFSSPRGILNARKYARDFVVTRMKDLDQAAVATYSIEKGMRLLVTFTRDRSQLAAAVDTLGFPTLSDRQPDPLGFVITPPSLSNSFGSAVPTGSGAGTSGNDAAIAEMLENMQVLRSRSQRAAYRERVTRFLDSFGDMARTLDSIPGRKHVLFLSEGFDGRELSGGSDSGGALESEWVVQGDNWKVDSDTRFGNSGLGFTMQKDLALFSRSDCVVHTVDIGGLRAASDVNSGLQEQVNGHEALNFMASETGGEFLKNANDLSGSFDRLLERTGLIYVLAFQPVRIPENGKFHNLKVRVKGHSYRVSARSGYYEPKRREQVTPMERKLALSSVIASAVPQTEIPAWVLAAAFPGEGMARVPVIVEIPGDRLLEKHKDVSMNLDVFVYAVDSKGATADYLYQPIGIDLTKVRDALRKTGIKFYGQLHLPAGDYTLRTLIRDNEADRVGLTITPLTVPAGTDAPFATPPLFLEENRSWILVKGKARASDDPALGYPFAIGGDAFIPTALASMRSGAAAQVCLVAYNFSSDASTLSYAGRILGLDGRAHGKAELKLLRASDRERGGEHKLLLQFRPSGLDPGRYALAVRLQDPKTGRTSESSVPFDVF